MVRLVFSGCKAPDIHLPCLKNQLFLEAGKLRFRERFDAIRLELPTTAAETQEHMKRSHTKGANRSPPHIQKLMNSQPMKEDSGRLGTDQ